MNNPNAQNPNAGPAKSGDQTQPGKGMPPSFESDKPQDSRDASPDDVGKQDDDRKSGGGKPSYLPNSGREDKTPMQAAKGDDDLMSKKPGKKE